MRQIRDENDLSAVRTAAVGYVFNEFTPSGHPNDNVLHAADCLWLERMNMSVPKLYFSEDEDAAGWLEANRGPAGKSWKRCGTCGARTRQTRPRR
jgi:hypothetical protein